MRELIYKLVNDAVNTNRATDQFELCISRVVKDEIMTVKVRQPRAANPAGQLCLNVSRSVHITSRGFPCAYRRHMVDIWFLYHRAHGMLNRTVCKLIVRMLVPNLL